LELHINTKEQNQHTAGGF